MLKYPKPEVLFIDHADSALIFRLRFWIQVDDYWAVPSKIRFDIDRALPRTGHRDRLSPAGSAYPQPA